MATSSGASSFLPVSDGQGHTIRYYQRGGTPPRFYMPARARAALTDPTVPLLVTEGEKKALKAIQEGLACVAVGGLWNWQTRHTEPGPSTVSRELAVRWLTTGEPGSIARALDALADFLTRYVVLRERRTALWIAAWALATWCYRAFRVFPYLSIRSSEKRCGKSRLLGLLARVCFNASPVTAHPTEAQLYRSAARTGGAQLFDEVETLRGDKDRFAALITVLNVGFERGGVVTRLEARRAELGETPAPAELLGALRARPGWDWLKSARRLAGLLNPLGIARRQLWNGGRRRWCYVLDAGQLADLRARYGAGGEVPDDGLGTDPGTPLSAPETGAIR